MKTEEFVSLFPSVENYEKWKAKWQTQLGQKNFSYALNYIIANFSKIQLIRAAFMVVNEYHGRKTFNAVTYPKTKFNDTLFWKESLEKVWLSVSSMSHRHTKHYIIFITIIPKIKAAIERRRKERQLKAEGKIKTERDPREDRNSDNQEIYPVDELIKQIKELGLNPDSYF